MKIPMQLTCAGLSLLVLLSAVGGVVSVGYAGDGAEAQERTGQHAEPDEKAGQQIFVTCARCHGSDGLGPRDGTAPAIAGQYARVVISELVDFRPRYANRKDPRMERIANLHLLSQPQEIAEVAYFVSTMPRGPVPASGSGGGVNRGKTLYQAQCAGCHGASAQGNERRTIPWLNSQHYEYLQREISYAQEQRRPNMEKAHATLFRGFTPQDVDGIADYLSRLPPT